MLHLINAEQTERIAGFKTAILESIGPTDIVVFMNLEQTSNSQLLSDIIERKLCPVYLLDNDCQPNSATKIQPQTQTISMEEFVELTVNHTPINSWY